MAGNLKKFVNPRFIKTIDLILMKALLARHEGKFTEFTLDLLDKEEDVARGALHNLLTGAEDSYPEGLRADLHRIAELGDRRGLEVIQTQADRQGIDLLPDMKIGDEDGPNKEHDPKHIAVRVFLEHPDLFDAAADHMAMLAADRLHEYAGRERGVTVDLTHEKVEAFRKAVAELFRDAFLGDYCRVGDYADGDEINLVVSHGSMVSTMPVVEGLQERVISVRQIAHAVLRYSENTGMLRLARIRKAHQPEIAELFAAIILERPGFFDGDDAHDLYTPRPVELAGPEFAFDYAYDPMIDRVLIIEAAADLMVPGKKGYGRFESLAIRYSDLALNRINERIRSIDSEKWQSIIDSALADEIKHISKEKIGKEGFFEVDPLYGYYASGSQQVIKRLRTEKGIDAERAFVVGDPS
jgi:hypothetical protein